MTSQQIDLLIAEGDPLMPPDWSVEQELKLQENLEQVRQVCVAEYSTVPEHQARAAKNPEYWDTFSIGRYNL